MRWLIAFCLFQKLALSLFLISLAKLCVVFSYEKYCNVKINVLLILRLWQCLFCCVCVCISTNKPSMKCFVFFFHVPLRSGVSDLTGVLHTETFWSHWWTLLLPSPATVFLLLFFLVPLLLFLKLPSPRPLCLPALGLLLKPTKRSNTVAGKGWIASACQHQTEDRRHKRTSEGERIKERDRGQ